MSSFFFQILQCNLPPSTLPLYRIMIDNRSKSIQNRNHLLFLLLHQFNIIKRKIEQICPKQLFILLLLLLSVTGFQSNYVAFVVVFFFYLPLLYNLGKCKIKYDLWLYLMGSNDKTLVRPVRLLIFHQPTIIIRIMANRKRNFAFTA